MLLKISGYGSDVAEGGESFDTFNQTAKTKERERDQATSFHRVKDVLSLNFCPSGTKRGGGTCIPCNKAFKAKTKYEEQQKHDKHFDTEKHKVGGVTLMKQEAAVDRGGIWRGEGEMVLVLKQIFIYSCVSLLSTVPQKLFEKINKRVHLAASTRYVLIKKKPFISAQTSFSSVSDTNTRENKKTSDCRLCSRLLLTGSVSESLSCDR